MTITLDQTGNIYELDGVTYNLDIMPDLLLMQAYQELQAESAEAANRFNRHGWASGSANYYKYQQSNREIRQAISAEASKRVRARKAAA